MKRGRATVLHVHRAERSDALVSALAAVLAEPLDDTFTREVVAVPTRGVERWLSQRLSHGLGTSASASGSTAGEGEDGVCAGVDFPSPASLVATAVAAVAGGSADDSPWAPSRLMWVVLAALDDAVASADASLAVLIRYLRRASTTSAGDTSWSHRRLASAQGLAWLFDSYAAQRPSMLQAWARGEDHDGTGERLPDDLRWQCELWRRVRARVGTASPAEKLPQVVVGLVDSAAYVALPPRLSVFGPTRLSTAELEILNALAQRREVHLWLPHPSSALWAKVVVALPAGAASSRPRSQDPTRRLAALPLLESLGRDARELQLRLAGLPAAGRVRSVHHQVSARPATLLGRLQEALAADVVPPLVPLAPGDFSLQLHACHGLPRQVEVLRELLVGMLADDPTLEPRDVVVMCPDVERVAPLVAAAFGRPASGSQQPGHPGQQLRVRLADRSLLQVNPLLSLVRRVLDLADARLTIDEVLGLAATDSVARRFLLRDDDLERLGRWLPEAGVRWGLDADHRARLGIPELAVNTWRSGLDRLLLGVAMTEDGFPLLGAVLPLDDVASNDAALAGRFAEFVDRLDVVLGGLRDPQPLTAWVAGLGRALDLLGQVEPGQEWQDAGTRRLLAAVLDEAGEAAATTLCLPDVRVLLADRLAGRPSRANFRTGDLTVCSLAPMRCVPHRVVCLLGLDDDAYPRLGAVRGDDVLARRPFVGDREVRSEDRQILLDAIHAASDRLVILYTGMNPGTNAAEPPAVPVGELLDTLVRMSVPPGDKASASAARARLTVRHPLQPFDERNLIEAGTDRPVVSATARPFSFDPAMRDAAESARGPRAAPIPIRDLRLAPLVEPEVGLDDLIAMLEHPAKAFLKQRLRVRPPDEDNPPPTRIPLELDNLQNWSTAERLLRAARSGRGEAGAAAELARGTLPPGRQGEQLVAGLLEVVNQIARLAPPSGGSRPVNVELRGGRSVRGTLPDVVDGTIVTATYSKLGPKHTLQAWVRLLAATASAPSTAWTALIIGRPSKPDLPPVSKRLGPLPADDARRWLAELVETRDLGLRQVLPTPAETARAYVQGARGQSEPGAVRKAVSTAAGAWGRRFGDGEDRVNAYVWGAGADLDVMLGCQPAEPHQTTHPSWFADLAHRIWLPLQEAEAIGGRA